MSLEEEKAIKEDGKCLRYTVWEGIFNFLFDIDFWTSGGRSGFKVDGNHFESFAFFHSTLDGAKVELQRHVEKGIRARLKEARRQASLSISQLRRLKANGIDSFRDPPSNPNG